MMSSITGGEPSSSFREGVARVVQRVKAAFGRRLPPPPPPASAGDIEAARQAALRGIGAVFDRLHEIRFQERGAAGRSPTEVPGAGWDVPQVVPRDQRSSNARVWGSEDAKYGRASTSMGITPQAWATTSGTNITLDRLADIHGEVDRVGLLHRKADLDFAVFRKDSHIKNAQRARASAVYRSKLQLRPRDKTPLAAAVMAFVRTVLDDVDGFQSSEEAMLGAAGHSYSGLEVVWRRPRTISFTLGNRTISVRDARGISSLEWCHPRMFRWDPLRRQMLLAVGATHFDPFVNEYGEPTHKLILHQGDAGCDPHNGGYGFAAEPLHLLKHQGVARWSVMLELLGIQTPYMQYDEETYAPDEDFVAAQMFLGMLGRGVPAVLARKFGEVKLTPPAQGVDARGQHMAIAGYINGELSKLINGQTLSAEAGGSGSYALANFQADSKEDVTQLDAQRSSDTHQAQTVRYIVEVNRYVLARALGATPEQICAVVPRCYRVLDRRIDPVQRLGMFVSAKRDLQLDIDPQQVEEELNIRILRSATTEDYGAAFPEQPEEPEELELDDEDLEDVEPASKPLPKEEPKEQEHKPLPPKEEPKEQEHKEVKRQIEITPSDVASIVTVNEARGDFGLPPMPDGDMTIVAFKAKNAATVAQAAQAEEGDADSKNATLQEDQ